MTAVQSDSIRGTVTDVQAAPATGLELLGPMDGSGYRAPHYLIRRSDGQAIQITPLLYALLELVDGTRTNGELAVALSERVGRHVESEDVAFLVERKLRPLGVLRGADV